MRYQLLLPKELHFDLVNYCKENYLKPQDVIRKLIRMEVYYEQSMAIRDKEGLTKNQAKEKKDFLKYYEKKKKTSKNNS